MSAQPAILLCGHGTRDPDGVHAFGVFADTLRSRIPNRRITHGFLELSRPSFAEAIASLYREGVREIIALPVLLFTAGHAKHDLPTALNRIQSQHPGLHIRMGRPLGLTTNVIETACHLVNAAVITPALTLNDTALLVIGRGTSDPDANSDVAKLARLVAERLVLPFVTTAYIAVAPPTPVQALALLEHLPFRHGIVLPTILFDGVLHKELAHLVANHRACSTKTWSLAKPFVTDTAWIDTFIERLAEVETGTLATNCQLCSSRHRFQANTPSQSCVGDHRHHAVDALPLTEVCP